MRFAGPETKSDTVKALLDVRTQLGALALDLTRKEDSLSRALDSGPADADRMERDLTDTRRWRSTAQYFAAWAGLYAALLDGLPSHAVEAEKDFKSILSSGDAPTPAKVDKGLLRYEHVARAAIGLAVCRALQGQDAEAMGWFNALAESDVVDPGVKASLIRWRIVVLAGAGKWADLDREVGKARAHRDGQPAGSDKPEQSGLDPVTARLLAVSAFENTGAATQEISRSLARVAVGDLIARKQLASVLDLARKYGADALTDPSAAGAGGFIGLYVRGMQGYEAAVAAVKAANGNLEEPATDQSIINRFNDAAVQLTQAGSAPDATAFKSEAGAATAISARALFMAGKMRESAERFSLAFERSRDGGDAQGAQENLYLAIVTLEKALEREPGKVDQLAIEERIEQLSTLFIKTYPTSERAVNLTLRSIARTDRTDEEAVRVLQSVNKDSAAYEAARRQLARLLYRLYRASPTSDRPFASTRYLKVADEVFAIDRKQALEAKGDAIAAAVERAVSTGRQMLDALLSVTPPDAVKAEQIMGSIKQVIYTTQVPAAAWTDELDFRTLQIETARGRLDKADAIADAMRARMDAAKPGTEALASARRFHTAARRVLLQNADTAMRSATTDDAKSEAARRVIAHGLPITDELLPTPDALKDPNSAAVFSRVAEAGAVLWRVKRDGPARDASLRLDRALVAARGPSIESTTRIAELSEGAGDGAAALEAWRSLASMIPEDAVEWHRAEYEAFRLLSMGDAKGAATAINQYLVLHPKGPEPWYGKIKEIGARVGANGGPAAPAAPAGGGGGGGGGSGGGTP
ncbi:MAG: hypothetical protein QM783_07870 [Phycisphaerales bacterium]